MSRLDCERWASLLDGDALQSAPQREDAGFLVQHAQVCPSCAAELAAWRELQSADPTLAAASDRDLLLEDAVLKKLWSSPPANQAAPTSRRRWLFAAGGCCAAAAVALIAMPALWRREQPTERVLAHVTIASGDARGAGGSVRRPGALVEEGDRLRAEKVPLCLVIEPGVRTCLAPGGELRLLDATAAHRRIELLRGRLVASLEPQPTGTTFSISTRRVVVTAIGTIFSVEAGPSNEVTKVRVLRGVVKVRTNDAQETTLRAHQALELGVASPAELTASDETGDMALLRTETLVGAEPTPALSPAPSAAKSAAAPRAASPLESRSIATAEPLAAGDLLRQALELRAQSRFADAARVYGKLTATHPGSAEGRAAFVSLGDLQLSRLGDAGAALRSFDAYLRSGDSALKQEAQYGRIRALRALRRPVEEQRAIEQLLSSYPTGVHAEPMRARLQSLKGDAVRP